MALVILVMMVASQSRVPKRKDFTECSKDRQRDPLELVKYCSVHAYEKTT